MNVQLNTSGQSGGWMTATSPLVALHQGNSLHVNFESFTPSGHYQPLAGSAVAASSDVEFASADHQQRSQAHSERSSVVETAGEGQPPAPPTVPTLSAAGTQQSSLVRCINSSDRAVLEKYFGYISGLRH